MALKTRVPSPFVGLSPTTLQVFTGSAGCQRRLQAPVVVPEEDAKRDDAAVESPKAKISVSHGVLVAKDLLYTSYRMHQLK